MAKWNNMCTRYLRRFPGLLYLLAIASLCPLVAIAAEKTPEFFTFTFENDLFVDDDDGYTHGMGITFGKGPFDEFSKDNLPHWLYSISKDLYISRMRNKRRGVSYMIFQRLQTPEDLQVKELIEDDIPYAGLLAWQATLYAWDEHTADHFSLYLGAVGPVTLAEQVQSMVHAVIAVKNPQGWDNQLNNEPVFKLEAQRVWNLYRGDGPGKQFDVLGLWKGGIGNLETATRAGLAIRWGDNLHYSFPTFSLQADRQVNPLTLAPDNDFYLFIGGQVGVVVNSIFVDGNSFRDSHSVPLDHYQSQLSGGVSWNMGGLAFVFQLSSLSSSTTVNDKHDVFGAFSITLSY